MSKIRAIDLFSGAGGSSWGARSAGVQIVAGFDMWELAGQVYKDNFPEARFYSGRLEDLDVQSAADFGCPLNRRRLFILCDRETEPSSLRNSR